MASIGQPFQPWATLALDDETLDAPIRALVHALNGTGWVWTVFSCAGHPEEAGSVNEGRRQAHVDVVTLDEGRWRAFARRCQDAMRVTQRHDLPRGVRLRVVEGSLGNIPDWLRPALRALSHAAGPPPRWEYRRLVFETVPYDVAPEACRSALDTALSAAIKALEAS